MIIPMLMILMAQTEGKKLNLYKEIKLTDIQLRK